MLGSRYLASLMRNIAGKKRKVKSFRDEKGRFAKKPVTKFRKETKLERERRELKETLPVKTKRVRGPNGRFVSKRVEKGLPKQRDEKGKFRKAQKSELELEVERLRAEVVELKENARLERLAGEHWRKIFPHGSSNDALHTMLSVNDPKFQKFIRYCRQIGMTPKMARSAWFSPRIGSAA